MFGLKYLVLLWSVMAIASSALLQSGRGQSLYAEAPCYPSEQPPECPQHIPNHPSIPLAHESDCTLFYQCDWGVRYLKACPGGLHFSERMKVCDWPWRAGCACDDQPNP